jgi:hypothetical protein
VIRERYQETRGIILKGGSRHGKEGMEMKESRRRRESCIWANLFLRLGP